MLESVLRRLAVVANDVTIVEDQVVPLPEKS